MEEPAPESLGIECLRRRLVENNHVSGRVQLNSPLPSPKPLLRDQTLHELGFFLLGLGSAQFEAHESLSAGRHRRLPSTTPKKTTAAQCAKRS